MRTFRHALDNLVKQPVRRPLAGNLQKELCQRLKLRSVIRRQLHRKEDVISRTDDTHSS